MGDLQMFQRVKQLNQTAHIQIPQEIGEADFDSDMGIEINSKERIQVH